MKDKELLLENMSREESEKELDKLLLIKIKDIFRLSDSEILAMLKDAQIPGRNLVDDINDMNDVNDFINIALSRVEDEAKTTSQLKGPFKSSHEGFGILTEEIHELTHAIQNNNLKEIQREAVQVSAVALNLAAICHKFDIEEQ